MIYLHRFQVSDYKNSNLSECEDFNGFEIDFRYLELGKSIVVSHDYSSYPVLDTFKNVLSTNKTIIANSKESGIEEKLFSKASDIILARCFRMLGLKSKSVNERADSADVIAESVHHKYSLVADAKCFRI